MRSLIASCKDVGVIPVGPLTVSVNSQRLEEKNDGGGGGGGRNAEVSSPFLATLVPTLGILMTFLHLSSFFFFLPFYLLFLFFSIVHFGFSLFLCFVVFFF